MIYIATILYAAIAFAVFITIAPHSSDRHTPVLEPDYEDFYLDCLISAAWPLSGLIYLISIMLKWLYRFLRLDKLSIHSIQNSFRSMLKHLRHD